MSLRADTSSDSDDEPASLSEPPAVRPPASLLAGNLSASSAPSRKAAASGSSPKEQHSPAADADAGDPTLAVAPSPATATGESPTAVTVAASQAAASSVDATVSSSDGRVAGNAHCLPSASSPQAAAQGPLAASRMHQSSARADPSRVNLGIFKDASTQQQLKRISPIAMHTAFAITCAAVAPDSVDPVVRNALHMLVESCGCSSWQELAGPYSAAAVAVCLAAGEPAEEFEPGIRQLQQALPNLGTNELFLQHMRSVLAHLGTGHLEDRLVQLWCQHMHVADAAAPRQQQQQQQVQAAQQLPVDAAAAATTALSSTMTEAPLADAGRMPAHCSLDDEAGEAGSDISVLRLRGGRGGSRVASSTADTETGEDDQPAQVSGPQTASAGTTCHSREQLQLLQSLLAQCASAETAERSSFLPAAMPVLPHGHDCSSSQPSTAVQCSAQQRAQQAAIMADQAATALHALAANTQSFQESLSRQEGTATPPAGLLASASTAAATAAAAAAAFVRATLASSTTTAATTAGCSAVGNNGPAPHGCSAGDLGQAEDCRESLCSPQRASLRRRPSAAAALATSAAMQAVSPRNDGADAARLSDSSSVKASGFAPKAPADDSPAVGASSRSPGLSDRLPVHARGMGSAGSGSWAAQQHLEAASAGTSAACNSLRAAHRQSDFKSEIPQHNATSSNRSSPDSTPELACSSTTGASGGIHAAGSSAGFCGGDDQLGQVAGQWGCADNSSSAGFNSTARCYLQLLEEHWKQRLLHPKHFQQQQRLEQIHTGQAKPAATEREVTVFFASSEQQHFRGLKLETAASWIGLLKVAADIPHCTLGDLPVRWGGGCILLQEPITG